MFQLGLPENLNVKYGEEQSGADDANIPRTLQSFGYSNPGSRIAYNTNDVVNELKSGYPVLICGFSSNAGHEWLLHGLLERKRSYDRYLYDEIL